MTVYELREFLEGCDDSMEVRVAFQPRYPFEYSLDGDALTEHDGVVYLAELDQVGYLPGEVRTQLGWRWSD